LRDRAACGFLHERGFMVETGGGGPPVLALNQPLNDETTGSIKLGGDLRVRRLGFGAMRLTGRGIWGEPADPEGAREVLVRAVRLGVNLIDTADSYGPEVSERLIGETLSRTRRGW
jgi:pyridoxine 4-dehydrogenase